MQSKCQGIHFNILHSFHKVIKVKLGSGVANGKEIQPLGSSAILLFGSWAASRLARRREHINYTRRLFPIQAMRSKSLVWDTNVLLGRELHPCVALGYAASSHLCLIPKADTRWGKPPLALGCLCKPGIEERRMPDRK